MKALIWVVVLISLIGIAVYWVVMYYARKKIMKAAAIKKGLEDLAKKTFEEEEDFINNTTITLEGIDIPRAKEQDKKTHKLDPKKIALIALVGVVAYMFIVKNKRRRK